MPISEGGEPSAASDSLSAWMPLAHLPRSTRLEGAAPFRPIAAMQASHTGSGTRAPAVLTSARAGAAAAGRLEEGALPAIGSGVTFAGVSADAADAADAVDEGERVTREGAASAARAAATGATSACAGSRALSLSRSLSGENPCPADIAAGEGESEGEGEGVRACNGVPRRSAAKFGVPR